MALPQINAVPQYELTMPSTGKAHKFRPFLVKEEKVLMIAAESQDMKQMVNAIGNIVESCVEGVKKDELSSIDIEYSFLQLRSKSVGETSKIAFTCKKCETEIPYEGNIAKIEPPTVQEKTKKIDLGNNIYLNLSMPKYTRLGEIDVNENSATDSVFNLITTCIDSIVTENDHIKASGIETKELQSFIEQLTSDQFKQVQEFIADLPRLKHEIEYECPSCKEKDKIILEGVQSFF